MASTEGAEGRGADARAEEGKVGMEIYAGINAYGFPGGRNAAAP